MRMPERRREQHGDAGHAFELLAHVRFDLLQVAGSVWLEDDEHIRHRVRHRILRPFRTTRSAHDVLDLGHLPQDVLDAVIEPIDFVQRRFGRQHRLQQKRALVQLRHEVAADAQPEHDARDRDQQRDDGHDDGMPEAPIQRRRVPLLDLAEERDVLVGSRARAASAPARPRSAPA